VAASRGCFGLLPSAPESRLIVLDNEGEFASLREAVDVLLIGAGGGFNNYLGALRSGGMIEGDGDRLMISEAGIQALGSWEPLQAGAALDRPLAQPLGQSRTVDSGGAHPDVS